MDGDRHDCGGPVGQPHVSPGERDLNEMLCKIACGMLHTLMSCSDVDPRGVIVSAEVRSAKPAVTGVEYSGKQRRSLSIQNDLWSFDHQLELQESICEPEFFLQIPESGYGMINLLDDRHLWNRDDPSLGNPSAF